MTGHDGARGLILGTDLPLFVSCFCIFAHTFASQMRPGGKQRHSYGDGTCPESSARLLEDSHHHHQGEARKESRAAAASKPNSSSSHFTTTSNKDTYHHLKGSLCRNGGAQTFDLVGLFAASEHSRASFYSILGH